MNRRMISSLTAENLACARGDRTVVRGPVVPLAAGQALAVEGANGAGKTSLLRLIAGFLVPQRGQLVASRPMSGESDDGEERGKFVGWLGHQDGLKPQLTVREQLAFFAALYRGDGRLRRGAGRGGPGAADKIFPAAIFPPGRSAGWRWRG